MLDGHARKAHIDSLERGECPVCGSTDIDKSRPTLKCRACGHRFGV